MYSFGCICHLLFQFNFHKLPGDLTFFFFQYNASIEFNCNARNWAITCLLAQFGTWTLNKIRICQHCFYTKLNIWCCNQIYIRKDELSQMGTEMSIVYEEVFVGGTHSRLLEDSGIILKTKHYLPLTSQFLYAPFKSSVSKFP